MRRYPLVQGREQWLRFAGAAVKRYPTSKVRETQVGHSDQIRSDQSLSPVLLFATAQPLLLLLSHYSRVQLCVTP